MKGRVDVNMAWEGTSRTFSVPYGETEPSRHIQNWDLFDVVEIHPSC
jgi:hypothetical protein